MPDADDLLVIRLPPPPLPTSWGRAVRPWEPCGDGAATGTGAQSSSHDATGVAHPGTAAPAANAGEQGDRVIAVPDVLSADLVGLWCGQTFQALLLNHGWEVGAGTGDASGTVASPRISAADVATAAANLARLPVPHLVPTGFVFVFVQKHLIQTVCRQVWRVAGGECRRVGWDGVMTRRSLGWRVECAETGGVAEWQSGRPWSFRCWHEICGMAGAVLCVHSPPQSPARSIPLFPRHSWLPGGSRTLKT